MEALCASAAMRERRTGGSTVLEHSPELLSILSLLDRGAPHYPRSSSTSAAARVHGPPPASRPFAKSPSVSGREFRSAPSEPPVATATGSAAQTFQQGSHRRAASQSFSTRQHVTDVSVQSVSSGRLSTGPSPVPSAEVAHTGRFLRAESSNLLSFDLFYDSSFASSSASTFDISPSSRSSLSPPQLPTLAPRASAPTRAGRFDATDSTRADFTTQVDTDDTTRDKPPTHHGENDDTHDASWKVGFPRFVKRHGRRAASMEVVRGGMTDIADVADEALEGTLVPHHDRGMRDRQQQPSHVSIPAEQGENSDDEGESEGHRGARHSRPMRPGCLPSGRIIRPHRPPRAIRALYSAGYGGSAKETNSSVARDSDEAACGPSTRGGHIRSSSSSAASHSSPGGTASPGADRIADLGGASARLLGSAGSVWSRLEQASRGVVTAARGTPRGRNWRGERGAAEGGEETVGWRLADAALSYSYPSGPSMPLSPPPASLPPSSPPPPSFLSPSSMLSSSPSMLSPSLEKFQASPCASLDAIPLVASSSSSNSSDGGFGSASARRHDDNGSHVHSHALTDARAHDGRSASHVGEPQRLPPSRTLRHSQPLPITRPRPPPAAIAPLTPPLPPVTRHGSLREHSSNASAFDFLRSAVHHAPSRATNQSSGRAHESSVSRPTHGRHGLFGSTQHASRAPALQYQQQQRLRVDRSSSSRSSEGSPAAPRPAPFSAPPSVPRGFIDQYFADAPTDFLVDFLDSAAADEDERSVGSKIIGKGGRSMEGGRRSMEERSASNSEFSFQEYLDLPAGHVSSQPGTWSTHAESRNSLDSQVTFKRMQHQLLWRQQQQQVEQQQQQQVEQQQQQQKNPSHKSPWSAIGRGGSSPQRPSDFVLGKPYSLLEARYVIADGELGSGQFGVIRKCVERGSGRAFACKTILKKCIEHRADAEDIRREASILSSFNGHPHIVSIHNTVEDPHAVHLIMELCEGGDLFDHVKRQKEQQQQQLQQQALGRMTERHAASACRQLASALLACHLSGVAHRDVKPENILLLKKAEVDGSGVHLKLADFGVATWCKHAHSCREELGTMEYMAPEVLAGAYGPPADLWSAGVVLHIMLSGRTPFYESAKRTLQESIAGGAVRMRGPYWEGVSEEAKGLVRAMLNRNASTRITAEGILEHPWIVNNAN